MAAHLPGQVEVVSPSEEDDKDFSYSDILVIGSTGMGKSTLANKLIGIDPQTKKPYETVPSGASVIKKWDIEGEDNLYFETGDEVDSVTNACKVLSNENTMIRVLDAPGFTGVDMAYSYGVARGNQHCLRLVLQKHREHDLRFSRIVYFMPQRGPPERIQGTFLEEIKVMHDYFGQKFFDIMVIAVTNNKREQYQARGFLDSDLKTTMEGFQAAFLSITDTNLPKCPPILYLPFDEEHQIVLNRIIGAEVISDAEMLDFSPEFPVNRSHIVKDHKKGQKEKECEKCALLVITEKPTDGEEKPVLVKHENGDEEAYDSSRCHPFFVQKHSRCIKLFGGLGHLMTLGLTVCYSWSWPGFTNNEQVCKKCGRPPRTAGCCPVNQQVEIDMENHMVEHRF